MKESAKILIAYDGSACSDAALNDLRRAGLPAAAEAVVITVADIILPPPGDQLRDAEARVHHVMESERHAQAHAEQVLEEARAVARRAGKLLKAAFPDWQVQAEVRCDSPAWAVVKLADQLDPCLVVVGSHGHSVAGGRLILGSVSQRVLYEARCSVRVARCSDERRAGPVRIVVGFNGSPDAEAAVEEVASRAWPEGSEAHVIVARAALKPEAPGVAVERLRAAGLTASEVDRDGDPAHVLIREAEEWGADSIFVGTRDLHGFQHLLHGSVSSAVAASAQCSVEVVRPSRGAA
ncbi:MAG TPA: universal stress protein [Pyrinomonadaceae bacterium]